MKRLVIPFFALGFYGSTYAQDLPSPWKITGFVDGYWGSQSSNHVKGSTRIGRQFDLRNEQFRLCAAQLNFLYTDPAGRFSATISPWIGDNARLLYLAEPGSSHFAKHLAQAYLTWNLNKLGASVDIGKFYSWIGYESPESWKNDLYSRGLLYTLAQPVYHTGARLTLPLNSQCGVSAFFTQGWNQSDSTGSGLTLGAQLRYTPNRKTYISIGVISGKEGDTDQNRAGGFGGIGFPTAGRAQTDLADVILTYQANPRLKLALNADFAKASGGGKVGNWSGYALSAKYQATSKLSYGARIESVSDEDGLRLVQSANVNALTLGADYALNSLFMARLEYRIDWSNAALFNSSAGSSRSQGTFNLSLGVRF